jgi:DNA-binding transcriptional LysR family regulator
MGLSSLHLDAFFAAAQSLNFSQAAKELHITQSALSQRIKALEEELDLTLFVRMPRGVQLTEAGARVLRYCQARFSLEQELLEHLTGRGEEGLGGIMRIGGYSSVVRSVLMPALAPLLRDNRNVQAHFQNAEMRQLPELLYTGQVDFIVTDHEVHRADLEMVRLGEEEYVVVDSVEYPLGDTQTYLDHDPDDPVTQQFLSHQSGKVAEYRRSFMDEIYAISDGVALGLGRAVISKHIAVRDERLKILPGYKPMFVPVLLHYHKQPYYTQLHKAIEAQLRKACPLILRGG